jgi:hypothetical protein
VLNWFRYLLFDIYSARPFEASSAFADSVRGRNKAGPVSKLTVPPDTGKTSRPVDYTWNTRDLILGQVFILPCDSVKVSTLLFRYIISSDEPLARASDTAGDRAGGFTLGGLRHKLI